MPGRAAGRWARGGDALSTRTTTGTMVLAGGGSTVVALSALEEAVWTVTAEPVVDSVLTSLADGAAVRSALGELAALGVVREVP